MDTTTIRTSLYGAINRAPEIREELGMVAIDLLDALDVIIEAAGEVAEGNLGFNICTVHGSRQWMGTEICEAVAGALQSASPCRIKPHVIIPLSA